MYFAVLDKNNIVTNIIVAESKKIAETVTGATCIEYNHENPACINALYDDGNWIWPKKNTLEKIIEEI